LLSPPAAWSSDFSVERQSEYQQVEALGESELHQRGNLFFKLIVEDVGQHFERLVDAAGLKGANLAEFKTDAHSEGVAVFGGDLDLGLTVDLVGNDDT